MEVVIPYILTYLRGIASWQWDLANRAISCEGTLPDVVSASKIGIGGLWKRERSVAYLRVIPTDLKHGPMGRKIRQFNRVDIAITIRIRGQEIFPVCYILMAQAECDPGSRDVCEHRLFDPGVELVESLVRYR